MANHRILRQYADELTESGHVERRLDRLDLSILEALQDNARTPLSEVGRRIGLSQPATSERVKRLEERGIIAGYGARIDPAALGLGMMAIIRLKTTHEHIKPALRAFAEMPHVIEVHRMTGEDCFLLKVRADAGTTRNHHRCDRPLRRGHDVTRAAIRAGQAARQGAARLTRAAGR